MHISPGFGEAFASWLNDQLRSAWPPPSTGTAARARRAARCVGSPGPSPGDRRRTAQAHPRSRSPLCCPSVDVLFQSLADEIGKQAVAVLLTGMGRDGARGLLAVRDAGGLTIAQDEATSVVFGMPREELNRGGPANCSPG